MRRPRAFPPLLVGIVLLLQAMPAAAYIDPGTGSALFYVVTGIVLSVYFALRSLYYRLLDLVFRIRYRGQRCGIAVHCEDPRYEITFMPVIRQLAQRGIDLTFFTMYERNGSFEPLPRGIAHQPIPAGMPGYAYLNNVEAVVMVTTTPQLDVMTFRRSRRVRHYTILQHALGECRYVRPYAYDHFDSVLCCGPVVKANIRRMEAIRGSRPKELLETGLPHYEALIETARSSPPLPAQPVILIAPSWGPLSMFETFGVSFVNEIARSYRVIVRPHPQMKVSQPGLYAQILALEGVEVNTDRTPGDAMARAHLLLSDISGITHEFAFIHERPVLIIDRTLALGGLEGEVLGGDSELKEHCRQFIVPVPPSGMPSILNHIDRALVQHPVEALRETRRQLVYNFGNASAVAARQIERIHERERLALPSPAASVIAIQPPAARGDSP